MVEERVLALYHFVNKHRHICNAHSVDFFVCNHWENAVSEVWGTLDKMPPDDLFLDPLASNTTGNKDLGLLYIGAANAELSTLTHLY